MCKNRPRFWFMQAFVKILMTGTGSENTITGLCAGWRLWCLLIISYIFAFAAFANLFAADLKSYFSKPI
jgi:hypothetical protein